MAYLVHIVLAIAALALAEEGLALELVAPLAIVALLPLAHAFVRIERKLVISGRFVAAARVYGLIGALPVVQYALAVLVFGWGASIESWTGSPIDLLGWPGPRALLALAPFVVFVALSIDARARAVDSRKDEIASTRRFQLRMFVSSLLPFVLLILASSLVSANDTVRAHVEHVAVWGGVFAAGLLVTTMATLPSILRHAWQTSALPAGRTRVLLEDFARSISFRCRELVQWHTGFQVSNAAVVGLGPSRIVLFSDLLLASLTERELIAVFAHEIAHVRRKHVLVFVAWSIALFLGAELAITHFELGDDWLGLVVLGATLAFWYFAFGWFSRRIELEADWFACESTGEWQAMASALERVGGPHGRAKDSWRHFGTQKRVEFLALSASRPEVARTLTRRLERIGRVGYALAALALAAQMWALASSYRTDLVTVDLALGRWSEAAQRAAALEELDSDVAAFVARAQTFGPVGPPAEALAQAGREARERGQRVAALEILALAQLRGARDVDDELVELASDLRTGNR